MKLFYSWGGGHHSMWDHIKRFVTLGKLRTTTSLEVLRASEPVTVAKDTLLSLALFPVPEEEGEGV